MTEVHRINYIMKTIKVNSLLMLTTDKLMDTLGPNNMGGVMMVESHVINRALMYDPAYQVREAINVV